jgi:hypothetical protein
MIEWIMKIILLVIFLYISTSPVVADQNPPEHMLKRVQGQIDFCALIRIESPDVDLFKLNWQSQDESCLGHLLPWDLCKEKNDQAYQRGLSCY